MTSGPSNASFSYRLVDASRRLDVDEGAETLRSIAEHLRRLGAISQAGDVFRRLNDNAGLASLLVESGTWAEALALVKKHPELRRDVYLPYARWLAEQERFVEAQQGKLLILPTVNICILRRLFCAFLCISYSVSVFYLFCVLAFYEAGCTEEAERVLNTLAMNAVTLNKYEEASHFFWLFAKHRLHLAAEA